MYLCIYLFAYFINRVMKSRRMRWAGHVACMVVGEEIHTGFRLA